MIGAGRMARRRMTALQATGKIALCGVAARHLATAQAFAESFGGAPAFDNYFALESVSPHAVLIEVPHSVQDAAALWVVNRGWHVLVGGPLASSVAAARTLADAAQARRVVVEAGFEARYKPVWNSAKTIIDAGQLGRITAGMGVALWPCDPASWYYDEALSGGMPLTHMTYCFLNPLRWLLGEPRRVTALANRLVETAPGRVAEESCVTLLDFPGSLPVSLTASYVRSAAPGSWQVSLFGSQAILEILPDESGPGRLLLRHGDACEERTFPAAEDGFENQAAAFLAAIGGADACRNRPQDCLGDLIAVEAIRRSAGASRPVHTPL